MFSAGRGTAGAFYTYGVFADSDTVASPAGPWTILGTNIGFTLSGGGDQASLTTFARIEPIPVPVALPLLLAGLGVMSVFARRRG